MRCTTRTRLQFCSSRMLLLTFERATCSRPAISSACIGRPSRKSSAWICDTVRFTPQRQPISPQCSTKRRPTALIASAKGSACSFAACAIEILDNRLLLSYISVKTEVTELDSHEPQDERPSPRRRRLHRAARRRRSREARSYGRHRHPPSLPRPAPAARRPPRLRAARGPPRTARLARGLEAL